jgi:hypothetical protein
MKKCKERKVVANHMFFLLPRTCETHCIYLTTDSATYLLFNLLPKTFMNAFVIELGNFLSYINNETETSLLFG